MSAAAAGRNTQTHETLRVQRTASLQPEALEFPLFGKCYFLFQGAGPNNDLAAGHNHPWSEGDLQPLRAPIRM